MRILRSTHIIYPESESDPGLDSCYNLKLGESSGHTDSIYPQLESTHIIFPKSEADPGPDSCYNLILGESEGPTESIYPESEADPGHSTTPASPCKLFIF